MNNFLVRALPLIEQDNNGDIIEAKTWIYGYYVFDSDDGDHLIYEKDGNIEMPCLISYNTIGRCLNREDSLGNLIFEGDIVEVSCDSNSQELGRAKGNWVTVVEFNTFTMGWKFTGLGDKSHLKWTFDNTDFNEFPYHKKVIGNIHQNKELI